MRSAFLLLPLSLLLIVGCQSKEERARDNIKSLGGLFGFDHDNPDMVTAIKFPSRTGKPLTDSGLKYVEGFTDVNTLHIPESNVTDAGLDSLKGLTKLEELDLDHCAAITDAGLAKLQGLTKLRRLRLRNSKVTDEGMPYLAQLTNLVELELTGTKITDEGLKELEKLQLPKLQKVGTGDTGVTEAGRKDLEKFLAQHQPPSRGRRGGPGGGGPGAGGPGRGRQDDEDFERSTKDKKAEEGRLRERGGKNN